MPQPHRFTNKHPSRSHVPMGAVRRCAEMLAMVAMADKIKSPEQRYLLLAVVALAVGAAETMWRDYVRGREERRPEIGTGYRR